MSSASNDMDVSTVSGTLKIMVWWYPVEAVVESSKVGGAKSQGRCYGLHVVFPSNSYVEILAPPVG